MRQTSGEIPSGELYLRATAVACLTPIMQYHSEFNHHRQPSRDRTPWNISERHRDPEVLAVFRQYAQLRERLVPYLAVQAHQAIERGLPLMRPLFLIHPDHPQVWVYPLQYLLGDHLLIAPVTEPDVTTWTAHLPAGEWIDVWTGQHACGPTEVHVPAPVHQIPVWCTEQAWPALQTAFTSLW